MAGGAAAETFTTFDEGWRIMQEEAIPKLIANLEIEGLSDMDYFTSEEFMRFYSTVYNLACAKTVGTVEKLYDQYKRTLEDYISSKVLPSMRGLENENLLRELSKRWNIYKNMTRWLSKFFHYLSRYYIPINGLPSLLQTSYLTFYDRVYGEFKDQVNSGIVALIDREREGEQIDRAMVKQVVDIFEETSKVMENYAQSIEYVAKDTQTLSLKSCEVLMSKIKESCENEKKTVSEFLIFSNKDKLLEVYKEIEDRVNDTILSLKRDDHIESKTHPSHLHRDRQVRQIDQVRRILEEIRDDASKIFAKDIKGALIGATALFYSKKALDWIATMSYEDYMLKVEECLEKEKNRLFEYLRIVNKNKVLEVIQYELLNVHAEKLKEKEAASSSKL